MLFLTQNRILVQNREKTYLTQSTNINDTELTIRAVDSNAWSDNDWVVVGEIGASNAEVLQVNGPVTDGTTITVDRGGSDGARYAHSVNEPVYRIDYNQLKAYRATTESGTKTLLATVEVQPDNLETRYEDISNTTGYGFVAFYNSATTALSEYSDAMPYGGRDPKSLAEIIDRVRKNLIEETDEHIKDDDITDIVNEKQREILNERMWTFNEVERSASRVANQFEYSRDSAIKTLHTLRVDSQPIKLVDLAEWERLHWRTDTESDTQSHAAIFGNNIRLYPRPSSAASSTTLDGALTAATTTITVAATSSFTRGDYYRFIIEDEVIYATDATATTFTGCTRGAEGTTAATHADTTAVTERDIIMLGQKEATDLEMQNDETTVPEPQVLIFGATAELAHTRLKDHALGDRYDIKYERALMNLRDKFTRKMTSQFPRIKRMEETIQGGIYRDPNQFPSNVQEA